MGERQTTKRKLHNSNGREGEIKKEPFFKEAEGWAVEKSDTEEVVTIYNTDMTIPRVPPVKQWSSVNGPLRLTQTVV